MVDDLEICKGVEACQLSRLGRLYSNKEFPIRIFRGLLRKVWKMEKLRVVKIRVNVI